MIKVKIVTAVKLNQANLKKVRQTVRDKYGPNIEFKQKVDPSVIGGVRLIIDYLKLDGTITSKIDSLKDQLLKAE